jgi:hypothetical protein
VRVERTCLSQDDAVSSNLVKDAERIENTQAVPFDEYAGSDLSNRRAALVNIDGPTFYRQSDCGAQASDTSPTYDCVPHALSLRQVGLSTSLTEKSDGRQYEA